MYTFAMLLALVVFIGIGIRHKIVVCLGLLGGYILTSGMLSQEIGVNNPTPPEIVGAGEFPWMVMITIWAFWLLFTKDGWIFLGAMFLLKKFD